MMRTAIVLAAGAALSGIALCGAQAADAPYRERAHVYERPVPRVYYQAVRPTAICRVVYSRNKSSGWPKEQGHEARCTRFD